MSPDHRTAEAREPVRGRSSGALAWWAAIAVCLLGAIVWFRLESAAQDDAGRRFGQQADEVLSRIERSFAELESEVRGVAAIVALEPRLSRAEWRTFVRASRPPDLSGLHTSAFYRRVPCADLDVYEKAVGASQPGFRVWPRGTHVHCFPLEFSSRDLERSVPAAGFDAGSEAARREAMQRALQTRGISYTSTIRLMLKDDDHALPASDPEPAVIAFMPVFEGGRAPEAGHLDAPGLVGFAGAGLRLPALIAHATGESAELAVSIRTDREPDVSVRQGEAAPVAPGTWYALFGSGERFMRERVLRRADTAWRVQVAPTAGFWAREGGGRHGIVLGAALLAALGTFVLLRRSDRLQAEAHRRHEAALEDTEARHQRMLAESQRRHRMAFDSAGMGLWEWNPLTDRLYVNNEAAAMLEIGEGDPAVTRDGLGEGWFVDASGIADLDARVHPEDRDARRAAMRAILHERRPMQLEYRIRARDGTDRAFRSYGNAMFDEQGRATHCFGTLQDVTETRALQDSVERGRRLLDAMLNALPYPVYARDASGRYVAANDLACSLFGRARERILGQTDREFFAPEVAARHRDEDMRVLREGGVIVSDESFVLADGSVRWLNKSKTALHVPGLEPIVVVALVDVTERRAAYQDARRSRDFLDAVLQSIPVAVCVKDEDNRFVLASEEMLRFHDLSSDEFIGRTDSDVFGPESAQRNLAQDRELQRTGGESLHEEQYAFADGRTRWVFKKKRAFGLSDGSRYVAVSLLDIEERKRAELSALRDRAFLEAIINAISSFVVVKDRDLRWVVANEAMARWSGRTPGSARGVLDADVLPAEVTSRTTREDLDVLTSGRSLRDEVQSVSASGERRWFSKSKSLLRMPDGEVYVIGVSTDIHDRKLAELRSQAAQRRLELLRRISEATIAGCTFEEIRAFTVETLAALLPGAGIAFVAGMPPAIVQTSGDPALSPDPRAVSAETSGRDTNSGGAPAVSEGESGTGARTSSLLGRIVQGDRWHGTIAVTLPADRRGTDDEHAVLREVTAALSAALDHVAAREERERAEQAVRAGRDFLDALLDALPQSVFVRDVEGRLVLANARFFDTIQRERSVAIGRTNVETYGPAIGAVLDAQDRLAWNSQDIQYFEQRSIDPAIPFEWQLKTKSAVAMPDGSRYLVCTATDITQRKRAELAAAKGREFMETLLNTFPQPVYVKDRQHRILVANDAACAQLGRSREHVLGFTDRDFLAPEYAERVWQEEEQLWETGQGYTAEAELPVTGQAPRWILKTKALITLADGTRAMIGTNIDITSRKAAEREVTMHRQRLEMLDALATLMLAGAPLETLQATAVMRLSRLLAPLSSRLCVIGDDDRMTALCSARDGGLVPADGGRPGLASLPWYREACARLEAVEVMDTATDARLGPVREALLSHGIAAWFDVPVRVSAGEARVLTLVSDQPHAWTDHERESVRRLAEYLSVAHLNAHAEDERAAAEAALRRHRDELERQVAVRTRELEIARDAAIAANEAKSEFLANMSHELRTPMHAILSFSRLGLDKMAAGSASPEKVGQYLERIQQSGTRLLRLLNDLLDLSKLEARQMNYEFGRTNLRQVVGMCVTELSAVARERGVTIAFDPAGPVVEAWCDPSRIGQVVANVIGNAIKFSPEGGQVQVELDPAGAGTPGMALFAVTDEGAGIPEGEWERVFDKFVQSSKTKSGAGGTGLGLAICREIVTQHGGRIWAERGPHGGARFVVLLPADPAASRDLRSVA